MRLLIPIFAALFATTGLARSWPIACGSTSGNDVSTPPLSAPEPEGPLPIDGEPGDVIERHTLPSSDEILRSLWKSARQRCHPAGTKVSPPGKFTFSVGLSRAPTDEVGAGGERTWRPTVGIARRF